MSAAKTQDAPEAAAKPGIPKGVGKGPTPESHHALAAHHAAAQHHHIAAAHALKSGKTAKAKEHMRTAVTHTEEAADQTDDLVTVYEVWTC
jgi:hypothetical protein